jgi:uncharacterized integral membrane protein (TIGR00697 family)
MKRYSFALVMLAMLSTVACLAANLISARTGYFFGQVAPMGVFFFPLIYVISDVISDVYGYRVSRFVAWFTLLSNIIFTFGILAVINLNTVSAGFSEVIDASLRTILTPSIGVLMAGIIGAVLGGWVNDVIFQQMRHKDGIPGFMKRKLASSAIAEIVDTLVFITFAFGVFNAAQLPPEIKWGVVANMVWIQFLLKYGVEVITAPIAKLIAGKVRAIEGTDIFEDRNRFNIFGFERKVSRQS